MSKINRYIYIIILLFTIMQSIHADTTEVRINIDLVRFKSKETNKIMELLALKQGMTVLDIGAGRGLFAYEYAERLRGTGKVFATDIDIDCIDYMKNEANRRGLINFYPVLVKKNELDEFYSRQKYDLITIFHVNLDYAKKDSYFIDLKRFMAKDGRLIIILYKDFPNFNIFDFTGDFKGLIKELSIDPDNSPFYKCLSKSTRELIDQNSGTGPSEALKKAIVDDFNQIISNNNFSSNFIDGMVFKKEVNFTAAERDFAGWLLLYQDRNKEPLKNISGRKMRQLNKLLIIQKFRRYLVKDRMITSSFTEGIKSAFGTAGYKLTKEYNDLLSFEDVLIFTVDKKNSNGIK